MDIRFCYEIGDTVVYEGKHSSSPMLITSRVWEEGEGGVIQRGYTVRQHDGEKIGPDLITLGEREICYPSGDVGMAGVVVADTESQFSFAIGDRVAHKAWLSTVSRDLTCMLVLSRFLRECEGGFRKEYMARSVTHPIGDKSAGPSALTISPVLLWEGELMPYDEFLTGFYKRFAANEKLMFEGYKGEARVAQ